MRKTLKRMCLSDRPGGACWSGVISLRETTAGAATCWAARGVVNFAPCSRELDCHTKERDCGTSVLPTQCVQFRLCRFRATPSNCPGLHCC